MTKPSEVEVIYAEFPGTCYLCGSPIFVNDTIQRWVVADNPIAAHNTCVKNNIAGGQHEE